MESTQMQPFLIANLSEVGNLLQAGKGTERPLAPLSMCKRLKPSQRPSGGCSRAHWWPAGLVTLPHGASFALHSPVHLPLIPTPWAALSVPLCLPLQGAPGRMGAQGDPGLKGYQVRVLFSSPSFYLFLNATKPPLQDANCS